MFRFLLSFFLVECAFIISFIPIDAANEVKNTTKGLNYGTDCMFSDGVGRSGAYVLLDMVLNRMNKGSKEIDIAATLEHIRDQRSGTHSKYDDA